MYVDDYLIKARRDELKHAAAQSRLAAQSGLAPRARRTHRPRPHRLIAAPARRLVLIRPRKDTA